MRATIREVAERAEVSAMAVSDELNGAGQNVALDIWESTARPALTEE
jgi:DNA-binding LacI/PurR family transcriptional regulator